MNASRRKQAGVTLLELVFVLILAGALLILGFRQYQLFRSDADLDQLQQNIDTIMQGMTFYYRANCYGTYTNTGILQPGTLNPTFLPTPAVNRGVDIKNELVARGFLTANADGSVVPPNPYVDTSSKVGLNGYVAQFNQLPAQVRNICVESFTGADGKPLPSYGPTTAQGCKTYKPIGTIILWRMQVAVLLKDTANANTYAKVVNADCSSSPGPTVKGNVTVLPCSAKKPGSYLVWERMPSMGQQSQSSFWQMNPTMQQFNQMYTTFPVNNLIATGGTLPDDSTQQQYFLCGG